MTMPQISMAIHQINSLVIGFIDNAFEEYKEDFQDDYETCRTEDDFMEFACNDFLFCTILHGESHTRYDIRIHYDDVFKNLMENDIYTYSKMVGIVVKYFREHPNESCQEIECFKPSTILRYYCFVFTKLNQQLFIEQHSPFIYHSEVDSGSEFEDD